MSDPEREAFLWMQGRMVELLLRHDSRRFAKTFDERVAEPDRAESAYLRYYRELAVLFYLRDELFGSILPRIKRRLSFAAPRELLVEELPPRGRIDWARTTSASWRDFPGEVPLEVHTRQRRRHFTTPENLLTVATLLEYRRDVGQVLDAEAARNSSQAIRHPLQEIVHACTRELVFPQFAGLVQASEGIVAGDDRRSVADLEQAVEENLLPGRNSAYDDLLEWRRKLAQLRLLDRTEVKVESMLGANPARDNYLYQLWLFYELGELLHGAGRLLEWNYDGMWMRFTWGGGDGAREYRVQHDQGIRKLWENSPGARPDFYVQRTDRQEVWDGDTLIWHEPGYVLDAKYYKPRDTDRAPASPIKRMIADLQITGERHGALLFGFHGSTLDAAIPEDERDGRVEVTPTGVGQSVVPVFARAQAIQPDICIRIHRIQPRAAESEQTTHSTLTAVLDRVHAALKDRVEVRCRGVFLDQLTATAHGDLVTAAMLCYRNGDEPREPLEALLLCPKPHVAPWRVDVVSHLRDCCRNAVVCHVKGFPDVRSPQRLVNLDDISEAIRLAGDESDDETRAQVASQQVLAITRRYAQLLQPDIATYRRWIRERLDLDDRFDTTALLNEAQRETLALGRFLWEQIEHIRASNFAGPVLLFTGVLEEVAISTVFQHCPPLYDAAGKLVKPTLGTLGFLKMKKGADWETLEQAMAGGLWKEHLTEDQVLTFSKWVSKVDSLKNIRNDAAHRARVDAPAFQKLVNTYFGSSLSGIGVLNALLLAWQRE